MNMTSESKITVGFPFIFPSQQSSLQQGSVER